MWDLRRLALGAWLALAAAGCAGQATPTPATTEVVITPLLNGYPGQAAATATVAMTSTPLAVPTPTSDSAVVTGRLVYAGAEDKPFLASLYLGPALQADQPGVAPLISFSEQTDPLAVQAAGTGQFLFVNVPPGTYGMVLWNPASSRIVQENKTGETLLFTVEAGQLLDLGVVAIP